VAVAEILVVEDVGHLERGALAPSGVEVEVEGHDLPFSRVNGTTDYQKYSKRSVGEVDHS
jgi:hypothetical protein